jgi:hypothetical protein
VSEQVGNARLVVDGVKVSDDPSAGEAKQHKDNPSPNRTQVREEAKARTPEALDRQADALRVNTVLSQTRSEEGTGVSGRVAPVPTQPGGLAITRPGGPHDPRTRQNLSSIFRFFGVFPQGDVSDP